MNVSPQMYRAIANAGKGIVPPSIRVATDVAKKATQKATQNATPKTYVSTSPDANRSGNTYKKLGPVSILQKSSTPQSRKWAQEQRNAQKKK